MLTCAAVRSPVAVRALPCGLVDAKDASVRHLHLGRHAGAFHSALLDF